MAARVRTSAALLPAIALVVGPCLAGCSGDPAPSTPTQTDVGVVHLPTSAAPTTDSAGHRIEPLPAAVGPVAMTEDRVRGMDYSYLQPVGWSRAERELEPPPDTLVQPDDDDVPAFVAVERPIKVGSHSLAEVVDGIRQGFEARGLTPMAAPEREIAGYRAMGIVVDQSEQVRHVYYVVAYTEQAFAIRLTYDPAHPEALDVYRAVLDSWSWG
jgi:hypothetical protein